MSCKEFVWTIIVCVIAGVFWAYYGVVVNAGVHHSITGSFW